MMLHRQTSAPYQSRFQESREGAEMFSSNMRRSVRNQEHDDWLQMKADELERLFAEHKRRIAVHEDKAADDRPVEVELDGVRDDRLSVVRGKFYDRYMQKRDSKLRENWGVEREVREMKMKAMWESLERSSAMLKAQSHLKTTIRDRDQLVEKNFYEEEDDKQSSDSSYKSYNSSRTSTKRSMISSTGRTSTSSSSKPIPRPSAKASSFGSARGSVSKLSDVRKENTKPPTAASKVTTNAQPTSFYRSKSTSAGIKFFKEEKPTMSSSSWKHSSSSPLKPLTASRDQLGVKPSIKKSNDTRLGPEARMAKQKATMITASDMDFSLIASPRSGNSNALYSDFSDYSYIEQPNVPESSAASPRSGNSNARYSDYPAYSYIEKPNVPASPVATPRQGNSNASNFFSCAAEVALPDGMELPTGNSVAWNPASTGKTRKKWGSAQMPVLASDASCHRKDTGKGLIRFLQFGRKSRGAENVVADLVATDLEVDDKKGYQIPPYGEGAFLSDQDIAMRNLMIQKLKEEHLSAGSPRAPRSFFSLPSFRNRGDDSKHGR